jgi:hypothetical protein
MSPPLTDRGGAATVTAMAATPPPRHLLFEGCHGHHHCRGGMATQLMADFEEGRPQSLAVASWQTVRTLNLRAAAPSRQSRSIPGKTSHPNGPAKPAGDYTRAAADSTGQHIHHGKRSYRRARITNDLSQPALQHTLPHPTWTIAHTPDDHEVAQHIVYKTRKSPPTTLRSHGRTPESRRPTDKSPGILAYKPSTQLHIGNGKHAPLHPRIRFIDDHRKGVTMAHLSVHATPAPIYISSRPQQLLYNPMWALATTHAMGREVVMVRWRGRRGLWGAVVGW